MEPISTGQLLRTLPDVWFPKKSKDRTLNHVCIKCIAERRTMFVFTSYKLCSTFNSSIFLKNQSLVNGTWGLFSRPTSSTFGAAGPPSGTRPPRAASWRWRRRAVPWPGGGGGDSAWAGEETVQQVTDRALAEEQAETEKGGRGGWEGSRSLIKDTKWTLHWCL